MAVYNNNFIEQIAFLVNFNAISLQKFNDFDDKLIEKNFNIEWSPRETTQENFEFSPDGGMKRSMGKKFIWTAQLGEGYMIEISDDYILLLFNKGDVIYKDKTILQKYIEVLDVFFDTFEVEGFSRVSLRYINNIKGKDLDGNLSDYIQGNLLNGTIFGREIGDLARSLSQFMVLKDGYNVMVKYGFWNNLFPSKMIDEDFILDIECSPSTPLSRQEKSIKDIFSEYNSEIDDVFEKVITDKMRDYLNK